jgi:hypothetical protein
VSVRADHVVLFSDLYMVIILGAGDLAPKGLAIGLAIEAATAQQQPEGIEAAHLVLRHLFADENASTTGSWESDNGSVPIVTWRPPANGGSFAALLGLAGTGLDVSFTAGGVAAWRDIGDSMNVFGQVRDRENCPVPTVIPAMGLTLTPQQLAHVSVRNGLAMADVTDEWLGGAQGFEAKWHGVLWIDSAGEYHLKAGAPAEGHEEPSVHEARHRSWRIVLRRGLTSRDTRSYSLPVGSSCASSVMAGTCRSSRNPGRQRHRHDHAGCGIAAEAAADAARIVADRRSGLAKSLRLS